MPTSIVREHRPKFFCELRVVAHVVDREIFVMHSDHSVLAFE